MNAQRSWSRSRTATVVGLAAGAVGIAILWASGVEFPIYPPPGIVILLAGAVFVGLARGRGRRAWGRSWGCSSPSGS